MIGKLVLIIDDSEGDVRLMEYAISQKEPALRMESASDGEAGLARLRDGKALPSLIILDMKMPGMEGVEVLRKIRGDEALKHIPVIVVTHSDLDRDIKEAYEAGANSVLHKASDLDRFCREVASLLESYL